MHSSFPARNAIQHGMKVGIVEKKNQATGEESTGTIARILTNRQTHPHGIKVMLTDGRVGRVKRIVRHGEAGRRVVL